MGALVSFHAHPDDESLFCGGTLARAAAEGHRTVIVSATRGERGEPASGLLSPGETLADRRSAELRDSARILGVARVVFLDYHDSSLGSTAEPADRRAFSAADTEEAAERLAAVLGEEEADAITIYDDHGVYPHPDHVKVHVVGMRAAILAGTPKVMEATFERDTLVALLGGAPQGLGSAVAGLGPLHALGLPASEITDFVDVSAYLEQKRGAMNAHLSQPVARSVFTSMSDDQFRFAFSTEWFRTRRIGR